MGIPVAHNDLVAESRGVRLQKLELLASPQRDSRRWKMRATKIEAALPPHKYSGLRGLPRCVVFDECSTFALRFSLK